MSVAPALAPGGVALWLIRREGAHRDPSSEVTELNPAARARMAELTGEARDAHLLSRAWAARALRTCFGPAAAEWQVGTDCNGRAVLRDAPPEIRVAFAHGRRTVAIAIAYGCGTALGVDLEDRLSGDDPLLASAMLSAAELRHYHGIVTGTARGRYLLRCWAAKEAYAKALGKGLALPFEQIEMVEQPPEHVAIRHVWAGAQPGWSIWLGDVDEQTVAALACEGAVPAPDIRLIGWDGAGQADSSTGTYPLNRDAELPPNPVRA